MILIDNNIKNNIVILLYIHILLNIIEKKAISF